jgi:hypothetical protein
VLFYLGVPAVTPAGFALQSFARAGYSGQTDPSFPVDTDPSF